ncbi:MAG TPA: peptidoglycan-binding protein, partial [Caulobacteraceae bacterium]
MVGPLTRGAIAAAAYALACMAASAVVAQDLAAPPTGPVEAVPPSPPPPPPPPPPLTVADGTAIEQAFQAAPEFPFPAALEGAAGALASPNPNVRAAAGAALAGAAIELARQEHGELDNPAAIDPNWAVKAAYDPAADFAAAREGGRVGAWAQGLARHDPAYLALLPVRRRYEIIRARGGWSALPPGLKLGPGARGRDVPRLRARLAAEGYGAADLASLVYDRALADEVAEFQRRHGLTASGSLTAATLQALNVTVDARLATIAANLERERWLPDPMPADR